MIVVVVRVRCSSKVLVLRGQHRVIVLGSAKECGNVSSLVDIDNELYFTMLDLAKFGVPISY